MSGLLQNDSSVVESRRVILAFVLAFGLYALWTVLFPPVPPAEQVVAEGSEVVTGAPSTGQLAAAPAQQPVANDVPAVADVTLESGLVQTTYTNTGARLAGVRIHQPEQYIPHEGMAGVFPEADAMALPLELRIIGMPDLVASSRFALESPAPGATASEAIYRWRSPDGNFEVLKELRAVPDSFATEVTLRVRNLTPAERAFDGLEVAIAGAFDPEAGGGMFGQSDSVLQTVCHVDGSVERENARGLDKVEAFAGAVQFAGVDERYFLTALVPGAGVTTTGCEMRPLDGTHVATVLQQARFQVPASGEIAFGYTLYTGPKDERYMTAVHQALKSSIDLGWFSFLAVPLRMLMLFFQGLVVNWGVAIILLVLTIKLLLYPVTQKSFESMEKMRILQPRLAELQKKYENDRMKLAEEQMKLFKEEGASPLGGCLPMLLQMPIYFALYRTIWGSAELFNAPFALWITDLSAKDPFYVLPLLCGLIMYGQQKLMPPQQAAGEMAEVMKNMNRVMPVMFTVFMVFLPSGLTLYIVVNMLLSIAQQLFIRRRLEAARANAK